MKNPIPRLGQDVDSCQIIIPQGQCNRQHDIYITMVGRKLRCVPEGKFVVTISTTVEGDISNAINELAPAIAVVGGSDNILERFDEVAPYFVPKEELEVDNCYCSKSYDATSHFETILNDVFGLYKRITGEDLDLDATPKKEQK